MLITGSLQNYRAWMYSWTMTRASKVEMVVDYRTNACACDISNVCKQRNKCADAKVKPHLPNKKDNEWRRFGCFMQRKKKKVSATLRFVGGCASVWSYPHRNVHKVGALQVVGIDCRPGLWQDISTAPECATDGVAHLAKTWTRSFHQCSCCALLFK